MVVPGFFDSSVPRRSVFLQESICRFRELLRIIRGESTVSDESQGLAVLIITAEKSREHVQRQFVILSAQIMPGFLLPPNQSITGKANEAMEAFEHRKQWVY